MTIPVVYMAAAEEKIKIIDAEGQEYYLPKTFELRSEPAAKRSATLDAAYVHGGMDVSDGMFKHRIIEISGKIWAASDAEYNSKWDAIAEHLAKEDFWIQNRNRRINIKKIEDISHDKQKTAYEIMPSLVGSEMCIRDSRMSFNGGLEERLRSLQ